MPAAERPASRDHRELHDQINELLAVLNRGISAHVLTDAHVDHGKAAEAAAELGAWFLHHAFVHGHVDLPASKPVDRPAAQPPED